MSSREEVLALVASRAQKTSRLYYSTARTCFEFKDYAWASIWQKQAAEQAAYARYVLWVLNGWSAP